MIDDTISPFLFFSFLFHFAFSSTYIIGGVFTLHTHDQIGQFEHTTCYDPRSGFTFYEGSLTRGVKMRERKGEEELFSSLISSSAFLFETL
jgi:hypothetical protein